MDDSTIRQATGEFAGGLSTAKISVQPPDQIWMEVCRGDLAQEKVWLDGVKSLRDISRNNNGPERRFELIEAGSDFSRHREKRRRRRAERAKAVLRFRRRERRVDRGKK